MIVRKSTSFKDINNKIKEISCQKDLDDLKQLIDSDVIEDIICNKCGKSCRNHLNFEGLIEAVCSGGYGSIIIGDETSIKFSLCEPCLGELINSFKHSPSKRDDSSEFSEFIEAETSQNKTNSLSIIKK